MALGSIGGVNFDNLRAGDFPIVTQSETVLTGQSTLVAGTVLGKITSGGKLKVCDSASSDGSQAPYAVLAVGIDTASGDVVTTVNLTGEFVINQLVFGGSDTYDTHKVALRALSIFGKNSVSVGA